MAKQVDIYVPTHYNDGTPVPDRRRAEEQAHLARNFGGLTVIPGCYGLWLRGNNDVQGETMAVWRVIVKDYLLYWWVRYREALQEIFDQEEILIVVSDVELV